MSMIEIRDVKLLHDMNIIFDNDIIVYGAGEYGKRAAWLLKQLGISILGFCDSDENRWGQAEYGYDVFSVQELITIINQKNITLIIAINNSDYIEEVIDLLNKYETVDMDCYTYWALKHTVEMHINNKKIPLSFRERYILSKPVFNEWYLNWKKNDALAPLWGQMLSDSVLVWQPAKVGSTTIAQGLSKAKVKNYHFHHMIGDWILNPLQKKDRIKLLQTDRKIKVISLVREPIGRDISRYFQFFNTDLYLVDEISKYFADVDNPNIYEGAIKFLENRSMVGECGGIFEWFNQEIKEFLGIDIYKYPFDRKKGYQILCEGNVELLLIKTEKLSDCEDVIAEFVSAPKFSLENKNMGENKLYKYAYRDLKQNIEIPEKILNFYYKGNVAMDHFYTKEEKENFLKKWLKYRNE